MAGNSSVNILLQPCVEAIAVPRYLSMTYQLTAVPEPLLYELTHDTLLGGLVTPDTNFSDLIISCLECTQSEKAKKHARYCKPLATQPTLHACPFVVSFLAYIVQ